MKFGIALNNLPFTPDNKQVIYVENSYDEKVNLFIRDNYDALVAGFKANGLEFVYLPLYFNADDIETKVRYYAPYLVSQIKEPDILRSSYLLNYMVHPENKTKLPASLLFAPRQETGEWIYHGFSLDDMIGSGAGVVDVVEKTNNEILRIKAEIEGEVRFRISPSDDNDSERARFRKVPAEEENKIEESRTLYRKVEECIEACSAGAPSEEEKAKKKRHSWDFGALFREWSCNIRELGCDFDEDPEDDNDSERARFRKVPAEEENKIEESRTLFRTVEESPEESLNRTRREEEKLKKKRRSWGFGSLFSEWMCDMAVSLAEEDDEEYNEAQGNVGEILADLQANVEKLRLMGVALGAIHEFIDKHEPLSQLVITDDLRLLLPLYNVEIELSAQKKALYFLFLNHPEGIVLQRLEDYHNEFVNYYKQTNKGVLTPKMEESIKKLEEYGNNQLNVLITRIREAFCLKFDERLARNYFISGERGESYRIPLDPQLVEWVE